MTFQVICFDNVEWKRFLLVKNTNKGGGPLLEFFANKS